ncbi:maltase 1-like [Hylaeus volcanicus]|uniref:maltase 1-like n=1 Tax=Hylaeus volcanicus TaxID=313075 RepID=UPI0023B7D687|nr:maltase 1-like [Hylaeus volcanicus]
MTLLRGCLLLILGLLLAGAKGKEVNDKEWWETALVYQIWPRGFQDSDGDGEGDLQGIISRLNYLKDLGIDAIWLNPVYPSPLVDSGYDISNHTDIHPLFGSLEHFDELLKQAHDRDLKVILDIVPNHSSDKHTWFLQSSNKADRYNDYYIWAKGSLDGEGNKRPPNNWASTYSSEEGSAWTWHDTRKEWYYHKFHKSQPDLNLRNKNVVQELLEVFKFWLEKGVDGFRITAASYLFEDENLRDEPVTKRGTYTSGLPENTNLLYTFRSYIDNWVKEKTSTSKLLIAESYDSNETLVALYGNETHKGIPPFNFRFITSIQNTSTAEHIKNVVEDWFKILPINARTNWVLSNHDNSRAASRIGFNRVDGLHMLSLLLPGQAYTYYGEEIAMLDRKMLWNETIDPMGCSKTNETYKMYSRDPARTPMQWNSNVSAGFSTNKTTYLPLHPDYVDRNVEVLCQKRSNLNTYKLLAALRKSKVFTHGDYELATLNNNRVFILKRSFEDYPTYIVIINLGLKLEKINLTLLYPKLEDSVEIIIASSNAVQATKPVSGGSFILTANAAFVIRAQEIRETTTLSTSTTTKKSASNSAPDSTMIFQLILTTTITVILFFKS